MVQVASPSYDKYMYVIEKVDVNHLTCEFSQSVLATRQCLIQVLYGSENLEKWAM